MNFRGHIQILPPKMSLSFNSGLPLLSKFFFFVFFFYFIGFFFRKQLIIDSSGCMVT